MSGQRPRHSGVPTGYEGRGLYRLFDAGGRLLYIGVGDNPETRWRSHSKTKPWWPQVTRKTVEWHKGYKAAEVAEKAAIKAENPLYNIAHKLSVVDLASLVRQVGGPDQAAAILREYLASREVQQAA